MASPTQPEASSSAAAAASEPGPITPASDTPVQDRPKEDDGEKKGFGARFITRAKTVLKKKPKRFSIFSKSSSVDTKKDDAEAAEPQPADEEAAAFAKYEGMPGVEKIPKLQLFEERARTLGQRFGLEINLAEWQSASGNALRMEKPIRMRVRRSCHVCNAVFGRDRECPSCGHPRCGKCIRSPPRRTDREREHNRARVAEKAKEQKDRAADHIVPDWDAHKKKLPPLTRPSRCGGQDLVRKKPRQRIRRHCHLCHALFLGVNKKCVVCSHVRCTDCPRDPAKRDKYPYGYPGDEFGPNSVPYHRCHECEKVFAGGAPHGTACQECGHEKCSDCPRMKPQKVEPTPDPDLLKSLQAKLDELNLK